SDVVEARLNPLVHYLSAGAKEERDPSPLFDTSWYLQKHTDVAKSRCNPLYHYARHGLREGRAPYDPTIALDGMKVAVVAHCFYDDVWQDIVRALRNIAVSYDLFVTIPRGSSKCRAAVLRTCPKANVIEVANMGRDIGAFMSVIPLVIGNNYDVICKIH